MNILSYTNFLLLYQFSRKLVEARGENCKSACDNEQTVKILSTDLSKAFSSLHPSLMTSELKAYGFHDKLHDLLRSYLCN